MQRHQRLAPCGPLPEIFVERNAGEFAFEVLRVLLTVQRVVQHGIAVVEDAFLGDLAGRLALADFVGIVGGELFECPVGDVTYLCP